MAGAAPFSCFLESYMDPPRSVVSQRLNLTEAETVELIRLVEDNLRIENRTYRYNYVLDNCATRPLALIEKSLLADSAKLLTEMPQTETTFRNEMRHYHSHFPSYQLFIDYALGSGIDRPITLRERAFAPVFLEEYVANSVIESSSGSVRPLADPPVTLLPGPDEPYREGGLSPWVIVIVVFALTLLVAIRDIRRGRSTKWFAGVFYGLFGIFGLLLAFLVFVSTHEATSPNVNLLWVNPLCLIVPLLIGFKRCRRVVYWYQIVNFVAVMAYAVLVPMSGQSGNWMFIPLIVSDLILSGSYIYVNRK